MEKGESWQTKNGQMNEKKIKLRSFERLALRSFDLKGQRFDNQPK